MAKIQVKHYCGSPAVESTIELDLPNCPRAIRRGLVVRTVDLGNRNILHLVLMDKFGQHMKNIIWFLVMVLGFLPGMFL